MAFTKIAAAGIGSTGTITLQHVVVTGSVETPVITGAASTANVSANSLVVSGVSTLGSVVATTGTFSGNVSIAGTLTYEDVTNIDSVGLITARSGIRVNSGGLVVTSGVSTLGTTSATNLSSQTLNVSGVSTFSNNPVLIGSGTSTGTTSQPLQVTGGAYVSGFTGIGVTAPTYSSSEKLEVKNGYAAFINPSASIAPIYAYNTDTTASTNQPYITLADSSGNRGGIGVNYTDTALWIHGQNGIRFRGSGTSPGTAEWARFDSSGNLGIGTASPAVRMHLHTPGNDLSVFRLSGSAANAVTYDLRQGIIGVSNGGFSIRDINNSTDRIVIAATGEIGIGINNPSTKLHVNGQIIGQVGSGSGILYTTYGALSSGQVAAYNNNLLGYNLRGYISSLDGGASNNNFYAMNTASYGFSGIEQAYGGFINFYTCNTTYQATTTNTTVTPRLAAVINPGGLMDAKYGVIAPMGWIYQNTYTANSTWSSGWQTIIPNGICSFGTYVVSLYWDYAGAPGAGQPYYITASTIFTTVPGTNGSGTENPVALLSATHTGGTGAYLQVRTIAFPGGSTGLQVNIVNYTAVSGTIFSVYVQKIGY